MREKKAFRTKVVAMMLSCFPSSVSSATTEDAIPERKMRPASCTWPTANGSVLNMAKQVWWTMLDASTSLISIGRCGAKNGSRKMMVLR